MAKYKAVTHLQDIHGNIVTPDSIVEDKDLGEKEVIDRYLKLEAIAEPTKDEVKAADAGGFTEVVVGGSIVGATEKDVKEQADDAAQKAADLKKK